jgi:hypothetical protein
MSVFAVVCGMLLVAIGLAALLAIPLRLGSQRGALSGLIPPESVEARGRLAAMVPPSSAIVGELPTVLGGSSLKASPPIEPPPADLSTIGCGEDKEEATAAVWREVRRALADQSRKARAPGGR